MLYNALAEAERLEHIPVNPMAGKKIKLPKRIKAKPAVVDPEKLAEPFRTANGTSLSLRGRSRRSRTEPTTRRTAWVRV